MRISAHALSRSTYFVPKSFENFERQAWVAVAKHQPHLTAARRQLVWKCFMPKGGAVNAPEALHLKLCFLQHTCSLDPGFHYETGDST